MDKLIKFDKKYPTMKWHVLWVINLIIMVAMLFLLHVKLKSNVDPDLVRETYNSSTNTYKYIYVYNFNASYIRQKTILCIICLLTIFNNFFLVVKVSKDLGKLINNMHPILKLILVLIMLGADSYFIYLSMNIILHGEYVLYYDMTYVYFAIAIVLLLISIIVLSIIIMTKFTLRWDKKTNNDESKTTKEKEEAIAE